MSIENILGKRGLSIGNESFKAPNTGGGGGPTECLTAPDTTEMLCATNTGLDSDTTDTSHELIVRNSIPTGRFTTLVVDNSKIECTASQQGTVNPNITTLTQSSSSINMTADITGTSATNYDFTATRTGAKQTLANTDGGKAYHWIFDGTVDTEVEDSDTIHNCTIDTSQALLKTTPNPPTPGIISYVQSALNQVDIGVVSPVELTTVESKTVYNDSGIISTVEENSFGALTTTTQQLTEVDYDLFVKNNGGYTKASIELAQNKGILTVRDNRPNQLSQLNMTDDAIILNTASDDGAGMEVASLSLDRNSRVNSLQLSNASGSETSEIRMTDNGIGMTSTTNAGTTVFACTPTGIVDDKGWVSYTDDGTDDGITLSDYPVTPNNGDWFHLTNNGYANSITDDGPVVDGATNEIFDVATGKIIPIKLNDVYSVRMDLGLDQTSGSTATATIALNINPGGAAVRIVPRTIQFSGTGVKTLSLSYPFYTGSTFILAGGQWEIQTTGNLDILEVVFFIQRIYTGKDP